jgi:hypothetical protein
VVDRQSKGWGGANNEDMPILSSTFNSIAQPIPPSRVPVKHERRPFERTDADGECFATVHDNESVKRTCLPCILETERILLGSTNNANAMMFARRYPVVSSRLLAMRQMAGSTMVVYVELNQHN